MVLKNKTALITGGGTGIGKAIAKEYAKAGASVIIISRKELNLKKTKIEILNEINSKNIDYFVCDIANKEQVDNLANKIKKQFGHLNILVNNAGVLGQRKTIANYPKDVWEKVININLNGTFYITKALIPLMTKSYSSIINLSSGVGIEPKKEWGAYSISKFAIEAFTKILSQELLAYNIRVNAVNPGAVRTDMRAKAYPNEDPNTIAKPDDITKVFLYLAEDSSKHITGKSINAKEYINK